MRYEVVPMGTVYDSYEEARDAFVDWSGTGITMFRDIVESYFERTGWDPQELAGWNWFQDCEEYLADGLESGEEVGAYIVDRYIKEVE